MELLAGADTCVAPVLEIAEVAADAAVRGPGGRHDGGAPDGGRAGAAGAAAGRHGAACGAGEPVALPDMTQTDTEHLLKEAGVDGETVARWVARQVVA